MTLMPYCFLELEMERERVHVAVEYIVPKMDWYTNHVMFAGDVSVGMSHIDGLSINTK